MKLGILTLYEVDMSIKHDYCEGTYEEKEAWIVSHIKVEFRNGYREVVGIPLNEKDPMPKSNKV